MKRTTAVVVALLYGAACGGSSSTDPDGGNDAAPPDAPLTSDWTRDILSTDLQVDTVGLSITATVSVAGSQSGLVSLDIGDTELLSVQDTAGADLTYDVDGRFLHVTVPKGSEPVDVVISYNYKLHNQLEGATLRNVTLTWPYYCGNLFPCKPDPADGLRFTASLTVADGMTAVYPQTIPADAPAYMFAWAIGEYTMIDLGTTDAGTSVAAYTHPTGVSSATTGTADLRNVVDWLEKNIGGYIFGNAVASVSASWGLGAYGGMEHHPFWHVSSGAMSDPVVHAHEAAHGWFGNGVRIACWEDFVLSEGLAEYLAARTLIAVGAPDGATIWDDYQAELDALVTNGDKNQIAWPDGCNELDILNDGLFGNAPYTKGAFFLRNLAAKVGETELDAALASFYDQYKGKAARFQDLLDVIETETGYDPQACALKWLRSAALPKVQACQ